MLRPPQIERMKHEATQKILKNGDYAAAYPLAKRANDLMPVLENTEFLASVLMGLGRLEEAHVYARQGSAHWGKACLWGAPMEVFLGRFRCF